MRISVERSNSHLATKRDFQTILRELATSYTCTAVHSVHFPHYSAVPHCTLDSPVQTHWHGWLALKRTTSSNDQQRQKASRNLFLALRLEPLSFLQRLQQTNGSWCPSTAATSVGLRSGTFQVPLPRNLLTSSAPLRSLSTLLLYRTVHQIVLYRSTGTVPISHYFLSLRLRF